MCDVEQYKAIFDRYGGMMRTRQLEEENIFYRKIQKLIQEGYVEDTLRVLSVGRP